MMKTLSPNTAKRDDVKSRAQASLLESLSAVSAAVAAMPETYTPRTRRISEAFMRADAVLAGLYKNIVDARANLAALIAKYGMNDVMVETLTYQLSTLEAAYAQRLALLRKRREEQSRGAKTVTVGQDNAARPCTAQYAHEPKKSRTWFMLAAMMLMDGPRQPMRAAFNGI